MKSFLKSHLFYKLIIILSSSYFIFLILSTKTVVDAGQFPDSIDYRMQAGLSFEEGMLAPKAKKYFSPRPFTIPLIYKMLDRDAERMVFFQKLFYCLGVLAFIFSVIQFIQYRYFKLIVHVAFLFFFTWWNIVGWCNVILSESLSFTFLLIWLSAILVNHKHYSVLSQVFLIVSSILLSFTRDSWPYYILLFFVLNFIVNLRVMNGKSTANVLLLIFSTILFFVQAYTVEKGERNVMPIFNSIATRVSQVPEYIQWFTKQGMPQGEQALKDFKGLDFETDLGKETIYARYADSTYKEMIEWIKLKGKTKYQQFILTHPAYFFLGDQNPAQKQRIFVMNVKNYYPNQQLFFHNAYNFFPIYNNYVVIILVLISFYLWLKTKKYRFIFIVILALLTAFNAFLIYNADTLEVTRHLYITGICKEMIGILASVFLIENLLSFFPLNLNKELISKNSNV